MIKFNLLISFILSFIIILPLYALDQINITDTKPYYEDGKLNYYFLANFQIGNMNNPYGQKYTDDLAKSYLEYLKNVDSQYTNYTLADEHNDNLNIGMSLEFRLMSDYGLGLGIPIGLNYSNYYRYIENAQNETFFRVGSEFGYFYYGLSIYYKRFFASLYNLKPYLLLGVSLNRYHAHYITKVIDSSSEDEDDPITAPYGSNFEDNYTGLAWGYHGIAELGLEINHVAFFTGLMKQYCKINEFKSGNQIMKYSNGEKVIGKVNSFLLYLGIGLFF